MTVLVARCGDHNYYRDTLILEEQRGCCITLHGFQYDDYQRVNVTASVGLQIEETPSGGDCRT